jgi:hypothetical protein
MSLLHSISFAQGAALGQRTTRTFDPRGHREDIDLTSQFIRRGMTAMLATVHAATGASAVEAL